LERKIKYFIVTGSLVFVLALALFIPTVLTNSAIEVQEEDCTYNGFPLFGKIQFVDSFPDIKIQVVDSFPDLKVKIVESFPNECGEWQIVDSFPDVKVQIVESFPDLKIKFVDSFPGLP
jgi:hypothetical protein